MPEVTNSAEQLLAMCEKLEGLLLVYRNMEAAAKVHADQAEVEGNVGQLMRQSAREAVYRAVANEIEALLNGE